MSGWGSNVKEAGAGPRVRRKPVVPKFSVKPAVREKRPREVREVRGARSPRNRSSSPATPRRRLSASPLKEGVEDVRRHMTSWSPRLPLPFDDIDVNEYNPKQSERLVDFKTKRSGQAMKKYLDAVQKSEKAVDIRRTQREQEREAAHERFMQREVERLHSEQMEISEEMEQENWREERLQRAAEREIERVASLESKKRTLADEDEYLDNLYETQLHALRAREQHISAFITRRLERDNAHAALQQQQQDLTNQYSLEKARLKEELHQKHQTHTHTLLVAAEENTRASSLHEAMEKGRLMRLAGMQRVGEAQELGILA